MKEADFITEHEAQQRKAVKAPLYSTQPHCTGPCDQGDRVCMTPEACQRAAADASDDWQPATMADNLAFWLPVGGITALILIALALTLGWRP
jgi:hypothetical protein